MILPHTRMSFDRSDAMELVDLLGRGDPGIREAARARLESEGIDSLLDDPRTLNAVLTEPSLSLRTDLVFYVLVRQALLRSGVQDPVTADYLTSVILAFGRAKRAHRFSDDSTEEFYYLVDLVERIGDARAGDVFLLRSHLGNYSLWLTGLFPDFLEHRVSRRGAPPIRYYEEMGSSSFLGAAGMQEARELGLEALFETVARDFSLLREALNRLADRVLWKEGGNPVGRILREVTRQFPMA